MPPTDQDQEFGGLGQLPKRRALYKSSNLTNPTGRFRDVTSGWQWLGRSRGATSFVNTRKDDVVYLLTTRGKTICVRPGETGGMLPGTGGVKALRISSSSRC